MVSSSVWLDAHCLKKIISLVIAKYWFYHCGNLTKFIYEMSNILILLEAPALSDQMSNSFIDTYHSCVSHKSGNKLFVY